MSYYFWLGREGHVLELQAQIEHHKRKLWEIVRLPNSVRPLDEHYGHDD